ncbi:MAG: HlyD family secretion protein [Gemmatimonadetes bacterium]|nr:MAG: HlyD family secretion protein [Gemmatimonadota bacterium]
MATTIERDVTKTESPLRESRTAAPTNGDTTAVPGGRRRIVFLALGVVLLLLIAGGVRKLIWSRTHETTDNAQVDGHMLPISPKVGGFVAEVRIVDNQRVKAGDTLVVLDDRDFRARLAQTDADYAALLATVSSRSRVGQAEALVRQAEATARKAHADLERLLPLAQQDIVSKQQLDAAQTAVAAADAQLAAAQAALVGADARVAAARAARDLAGLQLSYTRVTAPMAGVVSKKSVEAGQLVQQGQPLMSLVSLDDAWVVANLKETQTADVAVGDPVDITVDAYPGQHFRGHVESLSPATGAKFSLLPADNATGNFTKVVQRIPVRIRPDGPVDPAHPLRPGMNVEVTITTKR